MGIPRASAAVLLLSCLAVPADAFLSCPCRALPAARRGDWHSRTPTAPIERHLRTYFSVHHGGLPAPGLYGRILHEMERPLITLALEATRGNQVRAAQLLGLNRNTLRKKIRELDIDVVRGVK